MVFVGSHVPSGGFDSSLLQQACMMHQKSARVQVIDGDESSMLLLRGKLCRANPMGVKGMKKGLEAD
jgi:hypothetical protein